MSDQNPWANMALAPLSHDEQRECVRLWQQHQDYAARDKLVRSMVRLCMQFVKGHPKLIVDDAMQNTLLRLTESIDKFDLDSPYTVGTYVRHWIIRGIHDTYVQCASGGTASNHDITKHNKRKKRENELVAGGMSQMRAAQIAYEELPKTQKHTAQHPVSLDKAILATQPEEYEEKEIYIHHVKKSNDRRIIQFNKGLIGNRRWTFDQLGRVMGKSRQAVNQEYQRGIRNIRGAMLKAHANRERYE
jgi:RNA polymerase sigma factor (sigma-70 family)